MFFDDIEVFPPLPSLHGCAWESWPVELRRVALSTAIERAISKVISVNCHIHHTTFTGPHPWRVIDTALSGLIVVDSKIKGNYLKLSRAEHNDKIWWVSTSPLGYRPTCLIRVTGITPLDVFDLAQGLPGLRLRTVEYAMDLMCACPEDVTDIFTILKRCAYVPGLRDGKFRYHADRENCTVGLGNLKMYERGDDRLKIGKGEGWRFKDLDRVRIEFTAHTRQLDDNTSRTVHDFFACPCFEQMMLTPCGRRRLRLVRFKPTSKSVYFTKEWDSYEETYKSYQPHAFQADYFTSRQLHGKASAFVEDIPEFVTLTDMMLDAQRSFDLAWAEQSCSLVVQHDRSLNSIRGASQFGSEGTLKYAMTTSMGKGIGQVL